MRINAEAIVDELRPGLWEVTVTGHFDNRRVYVIEGSDDQAAQKGLSKYVSEMENLLGAANEN